MHGEQSESRKRETEKVRMYYITAYLLVAATLNCRTYSWLLLIHNLENACDA